MPMKLCRIMSLLIILIFPYVLPLAAQDIPPSNWPGAGKISAAVDGDGGSCPPTSYGTGTESPCSPIEAVSGSETPSEGSQYLVEGGKSPFSWEVSAGTINSETGVIESLSGACGSGEVTVTDACGNTKSLPVRFPSGQWVLKSNNVTYPVGYDYLVRELVVGGTKTQSYYSKSGVECSPQWYHSNSDSCVEQLYCSSMPELQPGSIGCSNISICGNTPTIPYYRDLPGSWRQEYYASGTCVYWWNSGLNTWKAGWWGFEPTDMARIYAWECP